MTTLSLLDASSLASEHEASGEPTWLVARRRAAADRFAGQAWPDSRADEFWRSTPFDLRFDVERSLVVPGASVAVPEGVLADVEGGGVRVVIVDGALVSITPHEAATAAGVVVTDLATAALEHTALVEGHLGRLTTSVQGGTGSDEDRTISLSDAAWTGGVFIHVPDEVELDVPISVHVHVATPGAHLPRLLVVVGHHAKATLYLEHTSDEGVNGSSTRSPRSSCATGRSSASRRCRTGPRASSTSGSRRSRCTATHTSSRWRSRPVAVR